MIPRRSKAVLSLSHFHSTGLYIDILLVFLSFQNCIVFRWKFMPCRHTGLLAFRNQLSLASCNVTDISLNRSRSSRICPTALRGSGTWRRFFPLDLSPNWRSFRCCRWGEDCSPFATFLRVFTPVCPLLDRWPAHACVYRLSSKLNTRCLIWSVVEANLIYGARVIMDKRQLLVASKKTDVRVLACQLGDAESFSTGIATWAFLFPCSGNTWRPFYFLVMSLSWVGSASESLSGAFVNIQLQLLRYNLIQLFVCLCLKTPEKWMVLGWRNHLCMVEIQSTAPIFKYWPVLVLICRPKRMGDWVDTRWPNGWSYR